MNPIINKEGIFWFKNDEKNTFTGKIIEENNDYILKTDILGNFNEQPEYDNIIIGKIDNIPLTIYNCYLTTPYPKLNFIVDYIFENYNYETELLFNNVIIKFHNLEDWIGNETFDVEFKDNNKILKSNYNEISFKQTSNSIKFLLGYTESWKHTSYCFTNKYSVKIEYYKEKDFKNILNDMTLIKKFLTFAMYTNTEIKSIKCKISETQGRSNYAHVHSKYFNKKADKITNYDVLIHFNDIKDKSDIFEKWFEVYKKYKPLFDIYFTNFSTNSTLEYEFLSHTQALEAYMRKNERFKDYYMDFEEYETIKTELNDYVKHSTMSEAHKNSWESRIKYGNEVSLRKRLKDLIAYLNDYDIIREIASEKPNKFIEDVIDNRNYYTHYDENSDFEKDIEKLITLNFKLKLLIELCILNELEFNDEFIENKLKIKYQRRPVPL